MSVAPERLPSGGLFGIKNFNLEGLYNEHEQLRNSWSVTNKSLPLMRYTGCKFKIYKPENVDVILTYDNNMPMKSSLEMYETLHPGVHIHMKHKLIVTSKKTTTKGKLYKTLKIKPPAPLQNKWYFQADLSRIPLCQLRACAASLDEFFIHGKSISTSMTITYINPTAIENTNFKYNETSGYYSKITSQGKIYLYSQGKTEIKTGTLFTNLVFLGQTQINQPGKTFPVKTQETSSVEKYLPKYKNTDWGNPWYTKYLTREYKVYQSTMSYNAIVQRILSTTEEEHKVKETDSFTEVFLTDAKRYNPFNDDGSQNIIFLKTVRDYTDKWELPTDQDLIQVGLPLWVLTFGFTDFLKKLKKNLKIDTEYMVVLKTKHTTEPLQPYMPLLDPNFIQGNSPYEKKPNPEDQTRWYPCTQMQQQTINNIAISGPGSPKLPPLESVQAIAFYSFYFKWGGNPPPMEKITDPKDQIQYHIPTNIRQTNSLQNPTTRPEYYLYNFDERRSQLTDKAIQRLQKDFTPQKPFISDGSHFEAALQSRQESPPETSSSEEEEETEALLLKLQQQRLKHKRLKQRLLQQLKLLKNIE